MVGRRRSSLTGERSPMFVPSWLETRLRPVAYRRRMLGGPCPLADGKASGRAAASKLERPARNAAEQTPLRRRYALWGLERVGAGLARVWIPGFQSLEPTAGWRKPNAADNR